MQLAFLLQDVCSDVIKIALLSLGVCSDVVKIAFLSYGVYSDVVTFSNHAKAQPIFPPGAGHCLSSWIAISHELFIVVSDKHFSSPPFALSLPSLLTDMCKYVTS